MSNSRKVIAVGRVVKRYMSSASEPVQEVPSPKFARLKEIQKKYAVDDGVPVYLKGGFTDRVLFLTTCGLVIGGFGLTLKTWYSLIYKDVA